LNVQSYETAQATEVAVSTDKFNNIKLANTGMNRVIRQNGSSFSRTMSLIGARKTEWAPLITWQQIYS